MTDLKRIRNICFGLTLASTVALLLLARPAGSASPTPRPSSMAAVSAGILRPFYPANEAEKEIKVPAFLLDRQPVTNGRFLEFVRSNAKWRKGGVSRLFADSRYLSHWQGPLQLGANALPDQPVTQVSWFAAKAYCGAQGARLPAENEWEFAAQASPESPDSRRDMAWRGQILEWYTKPHSGALEPVGRGKPNYWGVSDLHGLVWEWVSDFNSNLMTSDNREGGDEDKAKFCGAGALAASEKDDYASFMRLAFRSSLKAAYTTANLGFRCARDL